MLDLKALCYKQILNLKLRDVKAKESKAVIKNNFF